MPTAPAHALSRSLMIMLKVLALSQLIARPHQPAKLAQRFDSTKLTVEPLGQGTSGVSGGKSTNKAKASEAQLEVEIMGISAPSARSRYIMIYNRD